MVFMKYLDMASSISSQIGRNDLSNLLGFGWKHHFVNNYDCEKISRQTRRSHISEKLHIASLALKEDENDNSLFLVDRLWF